VNLADGKAVDAVLTLAINGNGVACTAGTDCISGNCVDGVCCDGTCDGACESCNQPGLVGECAPAMMGTDPDSDCAAKLPPTGNGSDDGGTDDGGAPVFLGDNPQACAGTCNGNRACTFPDSSISCGANVCSAAATVAGFFCDSMGGCSAQTNQCTDYNCKNGACLALCNSDADCQPTDFCNLNINKCVAKHDDGTACAMGDECKSTFCYSGVCCNTQCGETGQTCSQAGNVGKCQCQGVSCAAGVACQIFFRDQDMDTFGDKTGTLANGNAKAGCEGSTPPAGYVADNSDCDDIDPNVRPTQGGFFTTASTGPVHTFDYNCDGTLEKGTVENPGASCVFCASTPPILCGTSSTCSSANQQSAYGCFFAKFGCRLGTTTEIVVSGLPANDCGLSEPTQICGTCTGAGLGPQVTFGSVIQSCH
jgi:hypothetical protein